MQFWQCSISLQFLQTITANDFAFGSLQNLQLLTSADCSVSLHAMVHCNSKCIAVIPLQFHCNSPAIVCSEVCQGLQESIQVCQTPLSGSVRVHQGYSGSVNVRYGLSGFVLVRSGSCKGCLLYTSPSPRDRG